MIWLLALAAIAAGALLPLQASINSRLCPVVGGPLTATLVSVAVSTLTITLVVIATRSPLPRPAQIAHSPWWFWIGGILGVVFVLASFGLVSRLGAAFLFALVVVGQMLASLLIDHFALLGIDYQPITPSVSWACSSSSSASSSFTSSRSLSIDAMPHMF